MASTHSGYTHNSKSLGLGITVFSFCFASRLFEVDARF